MNHHLYFAGAGMALLAPLLAYREYKKEKIDMEQNQKRLRELREQISEKKYYNSEALRMVL